MFHFETLPHSKLPAKKWIALKIPKSQGVISSTAHLNSTAKVVHISPHFLEFSLRVRVPFPGDPWRVVFNFMVCTTVAKIFVSSSGGACHKERLMTTWHVGLRQIIAIALFLSHVSSATGTGILRQF